MKKGFTLAEALIALAVIGTISAMVIPAFVKDYKYNVFSSTLKKQIAQIDAAVSQEITDEQVENFVMTSAGAENNTADCTSGPCYFLNKHFKVINSGWISGSATPEFVSSSYNPQGGTAAGYCILTNDGATICMNRPDGQPITFMVDVNSTDGPNYAGADAFTFQIGLDNKITDTDVKAKCTTHNGVTFGGGCLNCVIENNWDVASCLRSRAKI